VTHVRIPPLHSVGVTHRLVVGDEFAALPFQRQLELFLADIEHPAQAYPAWLARTIKSRAPDLPSDVRQALLWRVRGRRYGPWRQLKRRLAALECERRSRDFAWPWDTGGCPR